MLEQESFESRLVVPPNHNDHILGSASAQVVIVEYADLECPYCRQADQQLMPLIRKAGQKIGYIFRNFPLSQLHPYAENAAEAAEIAGTKSKFWDMIELLFQHQHQLDDQSLIDYAKSLDIDATFFTRELLKHTQAPRVRADYLSGIRSGVNSTPTFFVNGQMFEGGTEALIDEVSNALGLS